ncbi:MAG: TolC family protein [Thiovulaceae bacterium]|nr:TolC family protein [Sulfurimonadaceae bacterium]
MVRWTLLLLPALLLGDDLKGLLDFAAKNSDIVQTKVLTQEVKGKELASQKSAYYPTVDIGASYQRLDEKSPFMPGETYSGYAKVGVDIYDGGRKSSLVEQKQNELKSSSFDTAATKKTLSLGIVQDFYNIKNLQATLGAKEEAGKFLKAQLYRVSQFYIAKMATKDEVDRLQSAFDTNTYEIEATKLQILSAKKILSLKVGKDVESFEDSSFKEPASESFDQSDSVKSLVAQKDSLDSSARALMSAYYPMLRVEDTYSIYGYGNVDPIMPKQPDSQNQLMITLGMRVFDNGSVEKSKEAVVASSQALNTQINYLSKEQKINFEIFQEQIKTSKVEISSATSALQAAKSAFITIEQKYNAGIADNVTYLDALASLTNAKALQTKALDDMQSAYAAYYYYSGKDIREFLK